MSELVKLTPLCPVCGTTVTLVVNAADYKAWQGGVFAQAAFPYLSPELRETLISGICPPCWDEMFTDNEDDN